MHLDLWLYLCSYFPIGNDRAPHYGPAGVVAVTHYDWLTYTRTQLLAKQPSSSTPPCKSTYGVWAETNRSRHISSSRHPSPLVILPQYSIPSPFIPGQNKRNLALVTHTYAWGSI